MEDAQLGFAQSLQGVFEDVGPRVLQIQLDRIEIGIRRLPRIEIARRGPEFRNLPRERPNQERVILDGAKQSQQLLARSRDAKFSPELKRVLIGQATENLGEAAGERLRRLRLDVRGIKTRRDEDARGFHLRQPSKKVAGAWIGCHSEAMFGEIGFADVLGDALRLVDPVHRFLV